MSPEIVTSAPGPSRTSGNVTAHALDVPGPLLLTVRRHGDHRGFFAETYSRRDFAALGIEAAFVQDNHSLSATPGTLRGLHFQIPPAAQGKLVRVLRGAVLDIVVDIRRASSSFGRSVSARLTAEGGEQFWVPEGFAHGFVTLAPDTEVLYKVTDYYAPALERGLAWDDPALALPWPLPPGGATLSDKDRRNPCLADLPPHFP